MIRVVLDANVVISGLISRNGPPGKILDAWLDGDFQLFVSSGILQEVARVLGYPRIRERLEAKQAASLLERLDVLANRVDGKLKLNVLTHDPSDNIYLACAVESKCDYLVTGNIGHFAEAADFSRRKNPEPESFSGFTGQGIETASEDGIRIFAVLPEK